MNQGMNRAERRKLAKAAPYKHRKGIERELRERGKAGWCNDCTFERHEQCSMGNCGCPCAERNVIDEKGNEVPDVARRRSGLYVARPKIQIPK